MKMISLGTVVAVATVGSMATAASQNLAEVSASAQKIIAPRLRDPASLVMRNTRIVAASAPDGRSVNLLCGEYNARNGFGGFAGFKQFVYEPDQMKGVVSMEPNLTFDFFSIDGSADLSHDPRQLASGETYEQWKIKHDRTIEFVVKYMPACLGLS